MTMRWDQKFRLVLEALIEHPHWPDAAIAARLRTHEGVRIARKYIAMVRALGIEIEQLSAVMGQPLSTHCAEAWADSFGGDWPQAARCLATARQNALTWKTPQNSAH